MLAEDLPRYIIEAKYNRVVAAGIDLEDRRVPPLMLMEIADS